jgi:hypothetical protein
MNLFLLLSLDYHLEPEGNTVTALTIPSKPSRSLLRPKAPPTGYPRLTAATALSITPRRNWPCPTGVAFATLLRFWQKGYTWRKCHFRVSFSQS